MIVRFSKNKENDVQKLRGVYRKSLQDINTSAEKIDVLKQYLKKLRLKNIAARTFSLGLFGYQSETIKLCKDEIKNEKARIAGNSVKFGYAPSPVLNTVEKLSSIYNQLKKMKIFYRLNGSFYDYTQIDVNEIDKNEFFFSKRNGICCISDKSGVYTFEPLFITFSTRKGKLTDILSYDNTQINVKSVDYFSRSRIRGLKCKKQTWLYHNEDYTKDVLYDHNPKLYLYELKYVKITFKFDEITKEFLFLGGDANKMSLFANLLIEYLGYLKKTYYELVCENDAAELFKNDMLYATFDKDESYKWVIFDILRSFANHEKVGIHEIYKKYNLTYSDLRNIVALLRKYSFFELSLGMELLPKYKIKEVEQMYGFYMNKNKESLVKGEKNEY